MRSRPAHERLHAWTSVAPTAREFHTEGPVLRLVFREELRQIQQELKGELSASRDAADALDSVDDDLDGAIDLLARVRAPDGQPQRGVGGRLVKADREQDVRWLVGRAGASRAT